MLTSIITLPNFYYSLGWIAVVFCTIKVLRYGMRPSNYPPGPKTFPIFGNLLQLELKDLHLQFDKWAKQCETYRNEHCPGYIC